MHSLPIFTDHSINTISNNLVDIKGLVPKLIGNLLDQPDDDINMKLFFLLLHCLSIFYIKYELEKSKSVASGDYENISLRVEGTQSRAQRQ